MKHLFQHLLLAALCIASSAAQPQTAASSEPAWPSKPITLIVPFGPGSGADIGARRLARFMTEQLKQSVVVDNRPGANGAIGTALAGRAKPDGYTLMIGSATTHATNFAFAQANLGYTPQSLDLISGLGASPVMLFVAGNSPHKRLPDLIADAKKNVGRYSCGSGNSVTEVTCGVFKKNQGIFAVTIPYRSNAASLSDLASGLISYAFSDPSAALALVEGGRIRPLAVAASQRVEAFKDTPTFAELGYKDMEITAWIGLFAPASTPPAILERLNELVKRNTDLEEERRFRARVGSLPLYLSLPDAKRFLDAEIAKWSRFVALTGVKPE
jgi:tripartite-type tricarboxylate transporter receptor subunit TctC